MEEQIREEGEGENLHLHVDCGAGRFMDAPDHVYFACKGCPSGKYQPDEGMTSCLGTVCPLVNLGSRSKTLFRCKMH